MYAKVQDQPWMLIQFICSEHVFSFVQAKDFNWTLDMEKGSQES